MGTRKGGSIRKEKLLAGLERASAEGWSQAFVGTRTSDGRSVTIASSEEGMRASIACLIGVLPANADDAVVVHGPFTIREACAFIETAP